ncbi:MAG TPA: helical backbone metal receptor [Mucilaginibacter sp.]|jgi:ABC-type Fe3+-hydroxamate transport system substrate-binding protein
MPVYYDQLNREIDLPSTPKRIISVVPSQTELLFFLGLNEEVIGITKFCIHPADKFKATAKVGGTKTLNINKIKALNPDLIIANKEENELSQIEELTALLPVWISDINNLTDALSMIEKVGELVGREAQANTLSQAIMREFDSHKVKPLNLAAAYFIWRKPYMIVGKNTFIDSMLQKCGLTNAFDLERYPEVYPGMITDANPNVIFLSSEPYPFKERHITEFKTLLPDAIIKLVDGEIFSWYGSRLLLAPAYFEKLASELVSS